MKNIEIEITPPSVDDNSRKEMMWSLKPEKQLLEWKTDINKMKRKHFQIGNKNKNLFIIFGIPTITIPAVIAGLNGVIELLPITISILMICSSIISAIASFMNFGKKSQLHFEYESKYSELELEIEVELCKHKIDRIACDVFLERIFNRYNALNSSAPV